MKNFFSLIIVVFLLNGCVGVESNLKKGNIRIGMYKSEFCYVETTLSGPCSATFMEGFNNVSRGLYYPKLKKEIMWAKKPKSFFVFKNVSSPFNYDTFSVGDGKLEKIFKTKEEAIKYVSSKDSLIKEDYIRIAKQGCKASGLEPGTEEFAECALKRIKELSE